MFNNIYNLTNQSNCMISYDDQRLDLNPPSKIVYRLCFRSETQLPCPS